MVRPAFIVCLSALLVIAVTSCSTNGGIPPNDDPHGLDLNDYTTPVVDIYTPTDNQVFVSGDTIRITGRVTDNGLYQGFVRISNEANSAILKNQEFEIHGFQFYNFNIEYKTSVTVASDYTVTVQFEDHGRNAGIKNVRVKVNP